MAKLFYTLEETAQKLGKSTDEVLAMARSSQLQEFRDKDKVMFKVEAIDLLASRPEEVHLGDLKLSDSAAGASGSSLGLLDDKESAPKPPSRPTNRPADSSGTGTGLGLMDSAAPAPAKGAPRAAPQSAFDSMGSAAGSSMRGNMGDNPNVETVGSGSGILDLTRESDDTTLGAEILNQAFGTEDAPEPLPNASGLFEKQDSESGGNLVSAGATVGIAPMPLGIVAEVYDGAWSGVGVAGMVAALVGLLGMALVALLAIGGGTSSLALLVSESWIYWTGGFAAVTAILMAIGFFVGKATE